MAELFWLSDAQWERIRPHLPEYKRGFRRVDDRRVISGIIHVMCCSLALPGVRRQRNTGLAGHSTIASAVGRRRASGKPCLPPWRMKPFRNGSSLTARSCARTALQEAEKGGAETMHRAFAWWPHDQDPPRDRRPWTPFGDSLKPRADKRFSSRKAMPGAALGCAGGYRR